jgi:hypothetical protein
MSITKAAEEAIDREPHACWKRLYLRLPEQVQLTNSVSKKLYERVYINQLLCNISLLLAVYS